MEIRTLPVGQLDTNCYIVWEADGQAVVIDPGAQAGRILDEADAAGVRVRAVLPLADYERLKASLEGADA